MTPPTTEAQERFHRLRMGLLSKGGKEEPAREERPQTPSEPNQAQERFHRLLMGLQGAPPEKGKAQPQQKPPEHRDEPGQNQKFLYRSRIGTRRNGAGQMGLFICHGYMTPALFFPWMKPGK